jgi:two-component system chemotaxis response regulator CheB
MAEPRPSRIRVLVVDDSALMRRLICDILESAPGMVVAGTARNGAEALQKVRELNPDVVTLDIEMPVRDGLSALQDIMNERPVPVVMLSAMNKRQADITMKALEMGAVDFFPKTSGTISLDLEKVSGDLLGKLRTAAGIRRLARQHPRPVPVDWPRFVPRNGRGLVVIGASTGGPGALTEVLGGLPRDIPAAILIVQHMPEGFTQSFAERLNWITSLEVREARHGDELHAGVALVAPGDRHMTIENGRIALSDGPPVNNVRPSVDVLMKSAAEFCSGCIGVLLTGMGADGAEGLREIKRFDGRTLVQDEATCVVFGMPRAAIDLGAADRVVPLGDMARNILTALEE